MNKKLSIVIPARNEEKNILLTLAALKKNVVIPHEIIVIDDHSIDNTLAFVRKYTNKNKNVIIKTGFKHGFSNAIRLGIKNASCDNIVIFMADLCDDPRTINKMYEKITGGWNIVCGCRYTKGGKKKGGPKLQNFFSAFVCKSLYYLIGIQTKDASNAFKMYQKSVFNNLKYKVDSGVESSLEFILRVHFKGISMIDVPTTWTGRKLGTSKFKLIERSPKYIKIYFWAIWTHFIRLLK